MHLDFQKTGLDINDYFKLIVIWNQLEAAQKVMKETNTNDLRYDRLLDLALKENKFDFTEIFLSCDINLKSFLTYKRLLDLYNNSLWIVSVRKKTVSAT